MRIIGKLVVLGFAGLGLYKAWEVANPKVTELRQRAAGAKARIEPSLRDTEETVQGAAADVGASLHDLSHTVAESVSSPTPEAPAPLRSMP